MTTSILAPSGPQRSRTLASLNRDDRIHSNLAPHLSVMLKKMLLEYIVRASEVKEFEQGLEEHQKAKVEGGGTVLERAVREHNVGACAKVSEHLLGTLCGDRLAIRWRVLAQRLTRRCTTTSRSTHCLTFSTCRQKARRRQRER